jgi:hypothetical protein
MNVDTESIINTIDPVERTDVTILSIKGHHANLSIVNTTDA